MPGSEISDSRRPLRRLLFGLAALTAICFFSHAGQILTLAFPVIAVCGAIYLFRKDQALYLSFALWMWCTVALVRRLADYSAGYHAQSLILLTPILVSMISLIVPWEQRRRLFQPDMLVFLLPLLAIAYGMMVGGLRNPMNTMLTTTLRWIIPPLFGLFCYMAPKDGRFAEEFQRTLVMAGIFSAAYGMFQYVYAPQWDCFWLTNVSVGQISPSFGKPVPFGIRNFGSLFSPGLQASLMATAFLLHVRQPLRLRWIALPLLVVSLSLTLIRTAWVELAIGVICIISRLKLKTALGMIAGICVCALLFPFLLSVVSPDNDAVSSRLGSFTDIGHDASAVSRSAGIRDAIAAVAKEPIGYGLGYLDSDSYLRSPMAVRDEVAGHDLGPLEFLLELGFVGTLLYAAGMFLLARLLWQTYRLRQNAVIDSLLAVCASFLAFVATGNFLIYFDGFCFWSAAALLLNSRAVMAQRLNDSGRTPPIILGPTKAAI